MGNEEAELKIYLSDTQNSLIIQSTQVMLLGHVNVTPPVVIFNAPPHRQFEDPLLLLIIPLSVLITY